MNVIKFTLYVFTGSFIWSLVLTYVGVIAGENWDILLPYFKKFEWLLVALVVVLVGWWIWRHVRSVQDTRHDNKTNV
jgi:membrane protein DedA with SNARE-associated domain